MPTRTRALTAVAVTLLGVLAIVAGGADDSPGLQGIGLLLIGFAVWTIRKRI